MRPLAVSAVLAALVPAGVSAQEASPERITRGVPQLARAPKLDGKMGDFRSSFLLRPASPPEASATFSARAGWHKGTLYVWVDVKDDQLLASDELTLSVFFPGAGPTALGHTFHLGPTGKRASPPEEGTPEFAWKQVEAGVQRQDGTLALEVGIPARAFPRFPAREPLTLELCLTYEDVDGEGAKSPSVSNCQGGAMRNEVLRLPDAFRKGLKLKPPEHVLGLEGRPGGWLGYGILHYPAWVQADAPLTVDSLRELVTEDAVSPEKVGVFLPESLALPDGRPLVAVFSGSDPYAVAGQCDADAELRLGLYLVKGKTAERVLEWPAATCALGRASSVVLDEEGALSIGYSSGPTINFAWSGERFERTEIGKR
ncbi:MAG TPA: hypothetical protein VLQ93_18170 [Myxococcaceae bacterium]|nr:hypothetical protein [Myxococcaceae bacterium]